MAQARYDVEALGLAEFTIVDADPWLVAGDGPAEEVARYAQTVSRATAALQRQYGLQTPEEVWTIWLFKDDTSYRHHALKLFRDEPETRMATPAASTTRWS